MDKKALRREIAAKKRALTPAQIEKASAQLAQALRRHPLYLQATSLYAYLSYNQEVRTGPILRAAWADGKRVAVPKILDGRMEFLWIDETSPLAPGYRGIPEPVENGPIATDPTALVLMPGLAFDPQGHRLGYGGGFYDRFLAAESHPTLALCYAFQLLPRLETEAHDILVDAVISAATERSAIHENRSGL